MEFVIKDLKDEVTGDNKSKDRAEQELVKLRADIGSKEKELQKIKPKYEEMKKKEDECTRELALKVILAPSLASYLNLFYSPIRFYSLFFLWKKLSLIKNKFTDIVIFARNYSVLDSSKILEMVQN